MVTFICKHCGKTFTKSPCYEKIEPKFCSKDCFNNFYKNKHKNFEQNVFEMFDTYCLLNGYFKIDFEDVERIKKLNCYISKLNTGYGCFVLNKKHFLFHRWLVNCPDTLLVDHRNRDISENRKSNLNIVNKSKNNQNKCRQSNNKTGYIGIHRQGDGYRAGIQIQGKGYRKYFKSLQEAIKWRSTMEKELNFYKGGV